MPKALDKAKLIKVLGLLGSEFEHEQLTALRLAQAMVKASGQTWEQLLSGEHPSKADLQRAKASGYTEGLAAGRAAALAEVENRMQQRPSRETVYWKDFVESALQGRYPHITEWEQGFLESVNRFHSVSDKQFAVLERMSAKYADIGLMR